MNLTKYLPYKRTNELDPFEKYRVNQAITYINGSLLDIGCGFNNLVRLNREKNPSSLSVGVDVYNWYGRPDIIADARYLPIRDNAFQSISFLASLNHIPIRKRAIEEARRVLADNGRIYVTMISPILGKIIHMLPDRDKRERGFKEGEKFGMKSEELISLFQSLDFQLIKKSVFELGLNSLYIFQKSSE